jgi:hypothetical protein
MLNELMVYARGLSAWPMDVFKDIGNNGYRGNGRRGRGSTRKRKLNMNRVRKSTKMKHRKAK